MARSYILAEEQLATSNLVYVTLHVRWRLYGHNYTEWA